MAEIPIEKKSGLGWLWILLGLLVLGLILWLLFGGNDNDDVEPVTDTAVVSQVDDMAGTTAVAAGALTAGEAFNISNARVTQVNDDMGFMVDDNCTQRFVVFTEARTPGDSTEGQFDINTGQLVNLRGTVMNADQPLPEGVVATIPAGTTQYLYADAMEVAARP